MLRSELKCAAALALLLAPLGATAEPSASHTIEVSATILARNACRFTSSGPGRLAFGTIDPVSSTDRSFTINAAVRCTGSDPVVTYRVRRDGGLHAGGGSPRMRHATLPGQYLPYALELPPPASVAKNETRTVAITGTVAASDFMDGAPGAYGDTVVLTIEP